MPFTTSQATELHYLVQQKIAELKKERKVLRDMALTVDENQACVIVEEKIKMLKNLMKRAMKKGKL